MQVRFLARSFGVPGDHTGQVSQGYRFPYGAVRLLWFQSPITLRRILRILSWH